MIELSELKIGMEVETKSGSERWLPGVVRKIDSRDPKIPIIAVDMTHADGLVIYNAVRTLDELRKVDTKDGG